MFKKFKMFKKGCVFGGMSELKPGSSLAVVLWDFLRGLKVMN